LGNVDEFAGFSVFTGVVDGVAICVYITGVSVGVDVFAGVLLSPIQPNVKNTHNNAHNITISFLMHCNYQLSYLYLLWIKYNKYI
jgi:hypothetical protein